MSDSYIETCPIWGTPAEAEYSFENDSWRINSPRAGGKYVITGTAEVTMGSLDEDQKVRLTSWLISQRMMGEAEPMITSDLEMDSTRRPSVYLRADNLLKYINSQVRRIDHLFEFPMEPPTPM